MLRFHLESAGTNKTLQKKVKKVIRTLTQTSVEKSLPLPRMQLGSRGVAPSHLLLKWTKNRNQHSSLQRRRLFGAFNGQSGEVGGQVFSKPWIDEECSSLGVGEFQKSETVSEASYHNSQVGQKRIVRRSPTKISTITINEASKPKNKLQQFESIIRGEKLRVPSRVEMQAKKDVEPM
jgi:hypothetical protein